MPIDRETLLDYPDCPEEEDMTPDQKLRYFARDGQEDKVKEAIDDGADLESVGTTGWDQNTALMLASRYGRMACVELLLDEGAKKDTQNKEDGWTALMHAILFGHLNVCTLLVERGASISIKNEKENTPLMIASYVWKREAILELLIEKKAVINHVNSEGQTGLIKAAAGGHEDTVEILLKHGAKMEIMDDDSETALMKAAKRGRTKATTLLLAAGADRTKKNVDGQTVEDFMWEMGERECYRALDDFSEGGVVVVIGAGFSALALMTEMVELGEKRQIICVDRNVCPGGMWLTPYEGLGLHGPRKSVSHPATYHLWKEIGLQGPGPNLQAQPDDLCAYCQRVQWWLEERGVRFLFEADVRKLDDEHLWVYHEGNRFKLEPVEHIIDARCSNIKTHFAEVLKGLKTADDEAGKHILIVGAGKQGADVGIAHLKKNAKVTYVSRCPIAFVAREKLQSTTHGLFVVLNRLAKTQTKAEWLAENVKMVEEGVLINPWESTAGNEGVEFHGAICSEWELDLVKQTSLIRGEFEPDKWDMSPYDLTVRCTGAFREAAVRDTINDNEKVKTMRFLYSPVISAKIFCAVGSHGVNGHPINYALYPNRFAMMNQLMCELCNEQVPDMLECMLDSCQPKDNDMIEGGRAAFHEMKPKMNDDAGVVVQTRELLDKIVDERADIRIEKERAAFELAAKEGRLPPEMMPPASATPVSVA